MLKVVLMEERRLEWEPSLYHVTADSLVGGNVGVGKVLNLHFGKVLQELKPELLASFRVKLNAVHPSFSDR